VSPPTIKDLFAGPIRRYRRAMKLWLPLLIIATAVAVHAEDAKPAPPPEPPAPGAVPVEQPTWQLLSAKKLKEHVRDMLYDSKFEELDAMIAEINDKQLRFLNGDWKLLTFMDAVSYPRKDSDTEDWKTLFQRLKDWDHKSSTIFTTNAIARTQLNYAYFIRTGSWSKDVTEEQWKVFNSGVERSLATYGELFTNPQKCVDMYAQLLRIGLAQGWPSEKMQATLQEAISVAPDYYPCYQIVGYYTLERWYGKPGASRSFLDSIPSMVAGDRGLEIYTRTALGLYPFYKENFFGQDTTGCADWTTMRRGFESILRTFPNSKWHRNLFAAYACVAKDRATARTLLDEITAKEEVVAEAWTAAGGFEAGKKWIMESHQ
jgi:hypothetical protein